MTTGKLMIENFPIGTVLNYRGNKAIITGYDYDDATPFAILTIDYSDRNKEAIINLGLARPSKVALSYNKIIELQAG